MAILSVFRRYPNEAGIIGRLLAGYGELEFDLSNCLLHVVGGDSSIKVMFRTRGEKQRIEIADALMRTSYQEQGLGDLYSEAIADMHHCRTIRNQYAHCHWVPLSGGRGLAFVELEAAAQQHTNLTVIPRQIDLQLLEQQDAYFEFVQESLLFIDHEYQKKTGRLQEHIFRRPPKLPRPPRYVAPTITWAHDRQ